MLDVSNLKLFKNTLSFLKKFSGAGQTPLHMDLPLHEQIFYEKQFQF